MYNGMFGHLEDVNLFTLKIHMYHHNVEDVLMFEDLVYLDTPLYKQFNVTIKNVIRVSSKQKKITVENDFCVINVIATLFNYIAARTFDSIRPFLSRDGIRVGLDTLIISTCPSITHITKYRRTARASYITALVQKCRRLVVPS